MRRAVIGLVAVGGLVSILAGLALAQDTPNATLTLSEGSVAAGIGFSWGKGMLSYEGKMYPVRVQGLSVGELGVTRATGPRLGRSLGRRRLPAEPGDRPMTRFSLIQGGTTP